MSLSHKRSEKLCVKTERRAEQNNNHGGSPSSHGAGSAMGSLWLRRRSLLGILGSALAAIHVVCCSTEQSTHRCSSNDCCLEYPQAADGSTALVRELLQPFSLEDFAEKFWERTPLVIRGRCVSARRFISCTYGIKTTLKDSQRGAEGLKPCISYCCATPHDSRVTTGSSPVPGTPLR